jgi:histidine triad (HIT) family protein
MAEAYDDDNIFARILRGEIPSDRVYEDDRCLAFRDVTPQAPTHILVIPKARISQLADAGEDQTELLGHLLWAVREIAHQEGFAEDGFRVVINNGARANQSVFHLHVHVLAGRDMTWPPG